MSLSIVKKYILKKEKDVLECAKILESIIVVDNNKMWTKKSEFAEYASEIINVYADKYYFLNNEHYKDPIEYSNDNINNILKTIMEIFKKNKDMSLLNEWKNEIFLMSVLVCTAFYVDFATNLVDGNIKDVKQKFKSLLKYLRKTKILTINENKYWINDLFILLKKNQDKDNKFFNTIKSADCYNFYKPVEKNSYLVEFKYEINNLDDKEDAVSKRVSFEYDSQFREISYELLMFDILLNLIKGVKCTYLIEAHKTLKKPKIIKMLCEDYIKDYINILVSNNDLNKYQNLGLKVVIKEESKVT